MTPGTITEDLLLEPFRANCLLAIARAQQSKRRMDLWFGRSRYFNRSLRGVRSDGGSLEAEIARIDPAEIVASRIADGLA